MAPKVLVPIDESATTQRTIQVLLENRDLLPEDLILLHVVDVHLVQRLVPDIQKGMVYEAAEKSGKRILEKLARPFQDAGLQPRQQLELGTPGKEILRVVEEQQIDLVVIGRHPGGGGFRDVMFGSVANALIRTLHCPILLI